MQHVNQVIFEQQDFSMATLFHIKITASILKARIKIVARAIYIYLFFLQLENKNYCDCC